MSLNIMNNKNDLQLDYFQTIQFLLYKIGKDFIYLIICINNHFF